MVVFLSCCMATACTTTNGEMQGRKAKCQPKELSFLSAGVAPCRAGRTFPSCGLGRTHHQYSPCWSYPAVALAACHRGSPDPFRGLIWERRSSQPGGKGESPPLGGPGGALPSALNAAGVSAQPECCSHTCVCL